MNSWKKILFFVLVIFLVLPLLVVKAVADEKVFKVGVLGPFTGPTARTGMEMRGSAEMAFEKIGYKIGDYKVELIWIDDQSDPAKATNAYAEAVERFGMQAGVNCWHSSVAVACMDLAAQYKVPHFGGVASSAVINDKYLSNPKYKGYWLKGWVNQGLLAKGYVDCLNNAIEKGLWKPEKKLVAILGEDTDWGRDNGTAFPKYFTATGWQVLSNDYCGIAQTDFYPLVNKYKTAGVTVIAASIGTQASVAAFTKQAFELNVKATIIDDGLGWFGEWYKLTGEASNHVLDMNMKFLTPEGKAWVNSIKEKYNYVPAATCGGITYDWTNFFIKVARRTLEKYKKLDKETFYKVIMEEVIPGNLTYGMEDGAMVMKRLKFSPQSVPDPVMAQDAWYMPIVQYMNGQARFVYPESVKEADFMPKK